MTTTILPKTHIAYSAQEKVANLLKPLSKMGNIHYFSYGVNYPDTSGFTLTSNVSYYETWFDNKFPLTGFFMPNGCHFMDELLSKKQVETAQEHNIGKIVDFIHHRDGKTEIFEFGARPDDKNAVNFYLNNMHLLKRFCRYFIDNAGDLISAADQERIIPEAVRVKGDPLRQYGPDPFYKQSLVDKISAPFNILSDREMECFQLILAGYSFVEIAQELNVSPKTIHAYFTRIKGKLRCEDRKQLFTMANQAGLVEFFLEGLEYN